MTMVETYTLEYNEKDFVEMLRATQEESFSDFNKRFSLIEQCDVHILSVKDTPFYMPTVSSRIFCDILKIDGDVKFSCSEHKIASEREVSIHYYNKGVLQNIGGMRVSVSRSVRSVYSCNKLIISKAIKEVELYSKGSVEKDKFENFLAKGVKGFGEW